MKDETDSLLKHKQTTATPWSGWKKSYRIR